MLRKNPVNRSAKEAQKWQAMTLGRSEGAWTTTGCCRFKTSTTGRMSG